MKFPTKSICVLCLALGLTPQKPALYIDNLYSKGAGYEQSPLKYHKCDTYTFGRLHDLLLTLFVFVEIPDINSGYWY